MSVSILRVSENFGIHELATLPHQDLSSDWFGIRVEPGVSYVVARNSRTLFLRAKSAQSTDNIGERGAGEFVEGLWEWDVFEIFLLHEASGAYQEWNLAPSGAWWTAGFVSYRQRDPGYQPVCDAVRANGRIETGYWEAELAFPIDQFYPAIGNDVGALSISVTAILGSNPRRYLSLRSLPEAEPDFHLAEIFVPITEDRYSP